MKLEATGRRETSIYARPRSAKAPRSSILSLAVGLLALTIIFDVRLAAEQPVDVPALVELLRNAQTTNGASFAQGRTSLRIELLKAGVDEPATIDGEVTWRNEDFLLKFTVSDPSRIHYQTAGDFGENPH